MVVLYDRKQSYYTNDWDARAKQTKAQLSLGHSHSLG